MYIQITTRCNMNCSHCCYSCTTKGKDMTMKTIKKVVEFINYMWGGEYTHVIGGGEPTIHPNFWEILGLLLSTRNQWSLEGSIFVITNGTMVDTTKALYYLGKTCALQVELSYDDYHDPISNEIINLFKPTRVAFKDSTDRGMVKHRWKMTDKPESSCLGIRSVTRIYPVGRGKEVATEEEGCACDAFLIDPEGNLQICGCFDNVIFGNINKDSFDEVSKKMQLIREYLEEELGVEQCVRFFAEKAFEEWVKERE